MLLAGNRIEQVVTVAPGTRRAHPGIVDELSALLGEPTSEVKDGHQTTSSTARTSLSRCRGASSNAVVLAIDENQVLLPGVSVQAEPVRYYPYGRDDGQHRRLCQRDHGLGVHAGQDAEVWPGHPVLPDRLH